VTVPDALAVLLARDPARPLVTHLGPGGERTELSVRTYENNVAKAANLLRDDADLQPGSAVALRLPAHWQTSVWLGAAALVGAVAWIDGPVDDPDVEVAVLGPDAIGGERAPLTLATALHPLGMPFREPLPSGVLDAAVEVRMHGDRFTPSYRVSGDDPWLRCADRTLTQAEALDEALALAASLGAAPGSRVLVTAPLPEALLALVALPLAADVAVVLLADPAADPAVVAGREGCATVLAG
jgi:uncharacterized protein (TIGR03089 family)